jgi:hypothetical protein
VTKASVANADFLALFENRGVHIGGILIAAELL